MKKGLEFCLVALVTLVLCRGASAAQNDKERHWANAKVALLITGIAFWYAGDEHVRDEIDQNNHLADMAYALGRPEDGAYFRDKAEKMEKQRTLAYIIGGISGLYATLELSKAYAKKPRRLEQAQEPYSAVALKIDARRINITYNFKF